MTSGCAEDGANLGVASPMPINTVNICPCEAVSSPLFLPFDLRHRSVWSRCVIRKGLHRTSVSCLRVSNPPRLS